ncbi:MAG: hypothetical protein JNK05_16895 [Myxococcales bacterium]|nr:hypothetical protein [Myxococcales bacterium]
MSTRSLWAVCLCVGVAVSACAAPDVVQRGDARVANDAAMDAALAMDAASDAHSDATGLDDVAPDALALDAPTTDAPVDDRATSDGRPSCAPGQTLCGSVCVDLNTSTVHCGICDGPCDPEGTTRVVCVAGACEITCDRLHGNCDFNNYNGCETPFEDDRLNCGACGNQCFRTQNCCGGRCVDTPCP